MDLYDLTERLKVYPGHREDDVEEIKQHVHESGYKYRVQKQKCSHCEHNIYVFNEDVAPDHRYVCLDCLIGIDEWVERSEGLEV